MRLEGRAFETCLRHALRGNDAPRKTIVILTDNMSLALAVTNIVLEALTSFSVVCAYRLFCNIAGNRILQTHHLDRYTS